MKRADPHPDFKMQLGSLVWREILQLMGGQAVRSNQS